MDAESVRRELYGSRDGDLTSNALCTKQLQVFCCTVPGQKPCPFSAWPPERKFDSLIDVLHSRPVFHPPARDTDRSGIGSGFQSSAGSMPSRWALPSAKQI